MNNEQSMHKKYFIKKSIQFPTVGRASSEFKSCMAVGKSDRNSLIPRKGICFPVFLTDICYT